MKFLRQRTIDELKLFGYSGMTIKNYLEAISAFSKYHGKSPGTLNEEDVKVFFDLLTKMWPRSLFHAHSSLRHSLFL